MASKKKKSEKEFDVREHIVIHFVTDGEKQKGWVHTHGMEELGLPELEIRDLPLFLAPDAGRLINHVSQYLYDGKHGIDGAKPVSLGEVMAISPFCRFKFVKLDPIEGDEAHFKHERWSLSDEPMRSLCH